MVVANVFPCQVWMFISSTAGQGPEEQITVSTMQTEDGVHETDNASKHERSQNGHIQHRTT